MAVLPPTTAEPGPAPERGEVRRVGRLRRWRRRLWLTVALVATPLGVGFIAATLGVAGSGSVTTDSQELDSGPRAGPAPGFRLPSLTDGTTTVALVDFRGRPVVLNFWASWCLPCRREMPLLAAADRRLGGAVSFVGVNYQDTTEEALALVDDTGVTYPSGVDSDGEVGRSYGLYGMPTTVFIAADGRIVGRYLGEMSTATLDRFLVQLVETGDV